MVFIPSQLAIPTDKLPTEHGWLFERKFDGYRAQLHLTASGPILFTRSGLDWSVRLKRALPPSWPSHFDGCVLDGEVCALDRHGRPDFARLGHCLGNEAGPLTFHAFDLLADRGTPTIRLPLLERKARLKGVVDEIAANNLHFVEHTDDGAQLMKNLRELGWEGIIAKDGSRRYSPGVRSPYWRKLKFTRREGFLIAGWRRDPVTGNLKSVELATFEEGRLVPRGSVGSGFTHSQRSELAERFRATPGAHAPDGRHGSRIHWIKPDHVAEVRFLELTASGRVRCAAFLGMRLDKSPTEVTLNTPLPLRSAVLYSSVGPGRNPGEIADLISPETEGEAANPAFF